MMDLHCDDIKQYAVRIEFHSNVGSGVIVKPNNDSKLCYVLTAKHTFENQDEINCEDIYIYDYYGNKLVCQSLKVDPTHDVVILFLVVTNTQLEKIEPIKVLNVEEFKNCIIVGYPSIRSKKYSKLECYKCTHDKTNDDIDDCLYEVQSKKPLEYFDAPGIENIQGLSGGGVFTIGTDGEYYIVGIQIEIEEPLNLRCVDLREIIEEINSYLPEPIGLEGYSFSEAIGVDPNLVDFDRIKGELKNDFINQIKNTEPDERLKYLKDKNSDLNRKLKNFEKEINKIAQTYLYIGILFHESHENRRATNNFKKSIKLNPSNKTYFATAKLERELRAKHTKELSISDKENLELEKRYKEVLELEEDNNSKLKHLRYLHLILLNKLKFVSDKPAKHKIYDDFIDIYLSMLNICSHENQNSLNKIKQAQILYNLALVYIFKEEHDIAKSFLKESLKFSADNTVLKAKAVKLYNNFCKLK